MLALLHSLVISLPFIEPGITMIRHIIAGIWVSGLGCAMVSTGYAHEPKASTWLDEIKMGVLYHDMAGLWSRFSRERGVDLNLEAIFSPHVHFFGGAIQPALGGSVNVSGDTSKWYAGMRWQYAHASGVFVGVGLGGAIHTGKLSPPREDRKALGSRVLFHIPLEIGYRFKTRHALSVYFDHVSNAHLAKDNEGLDTLGIRYGYRF